jgi:hypothetical protein
MTEAELRQWIEWWCVRHLPDPEDQRRFLAGAAISLGDA